MRNDPYLLFDFWKGMSLYLGLEIALRNHYITPLIYFGHASYAFIMIHIYKATCVGILEH